MKTPIPPIHETAGELRRRLPAERDAPRQPRLQALYLLQTQHARTRRQVAPRLGGKRDPVGRWRATSARGGIPPRLTSAKAPGTPPRRSEGMRPALQERLAQPQGWGSYQAMWPWLRQEFGVPRADKTVQKLVRDTLRATLKVPRKAPIQKPCGRDHLARGVYRPAAAPTHRAPGRVVTTS